MRVILKQSVPKVGKEGQVVRVKAGFARNFLFPRGMAVVADKSQVRVLEARNKRLEKQLEATKSGAEEIAAKLNGKRIRMEVRSGAGQRLFGAVTSQDIADAIKEQLGVELEKKLVGILQPIKQLGHFGIDIDLHRHVDCRVHLDVVDPVLEEEARKAAEGKGKATEAKSQKALAEEAIEKIEAEQSEAEEETPEA
jgi:large subunit ribosomal protein L9